MDMVPVATTLARARPVLVLRRVVPVGRTLVLAAARTLVLGRRLRPTVLMSGLMLLRCVVLLRVMLLLRVLLAMVVPLGKPQMRRRGVRATDREGH